MRNTAYFVVVGVPLTVVGALLLAAALNQGIGRLRTLFRVGYYLPVVTSIVAIAVIWRYVLEPDIGLVNTLLAGSASTGRNWLGDPRTTMPSIIALGRVAQRRPGDGDLPGRAADGRPAALRRRARSTAPRGCRSSATSRCRCCKPAILFVAVITSIGYLQVFEEPFVMTGPTGGSQQAGVHDLDVRLPGGLPLLQPRLRERHGLRAVHGDRRAGDPPVPLPEERRHERRRAHRSRSRPRASARATRRGRARARRPRAVVAVSSLLDARPGADDRPVRVDAAGRVQARRRAAARPRRRCCRRTGRSSNFSEPVLQARLRDATSSTRRSSP